MRIKKVLNSSVVLVEDDAHQESILLGKGIGFGQKPGNVIVENQENQVISSSCCLTSASAVSC